MTLAAEGGHSKISKALYCLGPIQDTIAHTSEKIVNEDRRDFNEKGEEVSGFASSTVGEDVKTGERSLFNDQKALVEGHYGSLANDSRMSATSLEYPHRTCANSVENQKVLERTSSRSLNCTAAGESASRAHSTIRKTGSGIWTVSTQRPIIDLDSFKDPVADAFWKDIWTASAVHNVCMLVTFSLTNDILRSGAID